MNSDVITSNKKTHTAAKHSQQLSTVKGCWKTTVKQAPKDTLMHNWIPVSGKRDPNAAEPPNADHGAQEAARGWRHATV
jgi:hypothetical protein